MKTQMYFDSKNISGGGGGVCRGNNGIISSLNSNAVEGDDGSGSSREIRGQTKKCKRVRRMRKRRQNKCNNFGERNREVQGEMIKDYLCKLQQIVPFSRKDKRLSKLEVITNAIDYIRELRETLGLTPCISNLESLQPDSDDTEQLPTLSSSIYSITCEQFDSQRDQSNIIKETSTSPALMTSPENYNTFPVNPSRGNETTPEECWGTLRPALWTISISNNHDNNSHVSSMISSSSLSSDKVSL